MTEQLLPSDPHRIGDYTVRRRLGAGGMGVVYLAEAPDGTQYAIKLLARADQFDARMRARLAREAQSLMVLDNPHVVDVVAVDIESATPYLVMSYVAGLPLDRAVPAEGLPPEQVRTLGAQLAGALAESEAHGIVHRDVKPNNIIIGPAGLTLVDFGIASLGDDGTTALTRDGDMLGSLAWLAPEVIAGEAADSRSDVFGLGLVLGYMALGRHPYGAGRSESLMYRIMHEQPDLEGCPADLSEIIEAALTRAPQDRPSAAQVHAALAHRHPLPMAPSVAGLPARAARPRSGQRAAGAWLLAGTAVAVGAFAVGMIGESPAVEPVVAANSPAAQPTPSASVSAPPRSKTGTVTFQDDCPQYACVLRVWQQKTKKFQDLAYASAGDSVTFPLPTDPSEGVLLSVYYYDYDNVPLNAIAAMKPAGATVGQPVSRQDFDAMSKASACWVPGADGTSTSISLAVDTVYDEAYGFSYPIAWSPTALPTTPGVTPVDDLSEPDGPSLTWIDQMCG